MKKTINDLIQLQELIGARAQHKTVQPQNHLTQLNKSIEKMLETITPDLRSKFEKIQKKSHIAIVPIHDGVCTGCGMNLPVSLVYEVKASKQIHQCPSCARILYSPPEGTPVLKGTTTSKYGPRKTGIARYSAPELMLPDLEAESAEETISALANAMADAEFTDNVNELTDLALERESIMSTAIDRGIAFPHVRSVEGGGLTFALGKSAKGIGFDPARKEKTNLIFFIVIPTAASAFYLKLLSGVTEALQNDKNRSKLLEADSPEKLWKALTQATRRTVK